MVRGVRSSITQNDENVKSASIISSFKSHMEIYLTMIYSFFSDVANYCSSVLNSSYFEYPMIKPLFLIMLLIVLFFLTRAVLSLLFFKRKESKAYFEEKRQIITSPFGNKMDEHMEDREFHLSGRKKRIPSAINYNDLFMSYYTTNNKNNKNKKTSLKEESLDYTIDNIPQAKRETYQSIDEFFERGTANTLHTNFNEKESKYDNDIITNNESKEKIELLAVDDFCNDRPSNIIEYPPKQKLETIKEEEEDEHSQLVNRLRLNNSIQKTAMSNFMPNKK
jgi:hypothetical protein